MIYTSRLIFLLALTAITISACTPSNRYASPWKTRSQTQEQTTAQAATNAPESLNSVDIEKQTLPTYSVPQTSMPGTITSNTNMQLPPLKVAILLPLSGSSKTIGEAMLQSAQLAVFEMGYENFELIPKDTKGTPQGALDAAAEAARDGAELVLGPLFANNARAVKNVLSARGINMVTFSTDWTLAGGNTYVMGFLPFAQVERLNRFVTAQGYNTVALIAPEDKYGNSVVKAFEKSASRTNLSITKQIRFPAQDSNITPRLSALAYDPKSTTPPPFQAVFMPVGGAQAETVANALSYYGLVPTSVKRLGTGLWDDPRLAREQNLQGGWFAAPSPALRRDFERRYQSTYGQKPPRLASLAYDATALAAVLAIRGYKTGNRPAFDRIAMTNPNGFAGMDGIFRFTSGGLVERGLAILEFRNGQITEIDPAPRSFYRATN